MAIERFQARKTKIEYVFLLFSIKNSVKTQQSNSKCNILTEKINATQQNPTIWPADGLCVECCVFEWPERPNIAGCCI